MNMENILDNWVIDRADEHNIDTEEACRVALRELINENPRTDTNMGFVDGRDIIKAAHLRETSVMDHLPDINQYDKTGRIIFPNKALVVAWGMELLGQLSDGAWVNTMVDSDYYYGLEVGYDTSNTDVVLTDSDGYVEAYPETHPEFEETIMGSPGLAGRIKFYVRASGVDESYTADDLREDLSRLDEVDWTNTPRLSAD